MCQLPASGTINIIRIGDMGADCLATRPTMMSFDNLIQQSHFPFAVAASGLKRRPRLHGAQTFREEGAHAAGHTSRRSSRRQPRPAPSANPQTSILGRTPGSSSKRSYAFSCSTRNLSLLCDETQEGRRPSPQPSAAQPLGAASAPRRAPACAGPSEPSPL